jgi:hypothetical protein
VRGPVPDPWLQAEIEIGLYGSITLFQLGKRLGGSIQGLEAAANTFFDGQCGSVPISILIWILLHRPPPPPPPWLSQIVFAGELLKVAQAAGQEALAAAAAKQLGEQLKEFGR